MEKRPVPLPVKSAFSSATLQIAQQVAPFVTIRDLAFFRTGYAATVIEKSGRSYMPLFAVDEKESFIYERCTCGEKDRAGRLCRHIALLYTKIKSEEGKLLGESYERGIWCAVGRGIFDHAASVRHEVAFDRGVFRLTTRCGDTAAVRLSFPAGASDEALMQLVGIYPAESRPAGIGVSELVPNRESLLRKVTFTEEEAALSARGHRTPRQAWEESFWSVWSRRAFCLFGEDAELSVANEGEEFFLVARRGEISAQILLTAGSLERLLTTRAELVERCGCRVLPSGGRPAVKILLEPDGRIRLHPVVLVEGQIFDRNELAKRRIGAFFFVSPLQSFITLERVAPLFPEEATGQGLFHFSTTYVPSPAGVPLDRETTVPEQDVLYFLERHRAEIAALPDSLVDPAIRNARVVSLAGPISLAVDAFGDDGIAVSAAAIDADGVTVSMYDLLDARKRKARFLIREDRWIRLDHDALIAFESAASRDKKRKKRVVLSKLDYLKLASTTREIRLDGAHEAVESCRRLERHDVDIAISFDRLGLDLYPYQQTGVQWLWSLTRNGFGGLLCDDMGLGKTHQAMALLAASLTTMKGRALICCPTSLIDHWREKLARYVPTLAVDTHTKGGRPIEPAARIVLTSYGILRNDVPLLAAEEFDLFIVDEIQSIKNRGTATHQALATIKRQVAIGLTGTPVENSVGELKTLVDFVVPGYLPGEKEFEERFAIPIAKGDYRRRERLQALVSPFLLRRTKEQVLPELPDKIVDKRFCTMTDEQRDLYRSVVQSKGKTLRDVLKNTKDIPYIHVFALLNSLKQICNQPQLVAEGQASGVTTSGKWNLFVELLEECLQSGLKVVIFSQYVRMLNFIEKHLVENGVGFATIKGSTRNRGEMLQQFRDDPSCRVFTASLRAAGVGIDLTSASVVIHYDRWWNQAREDQATDRVHRLGQTKGVQVLKLITRGSIEEKIDQIIERKGALASDLVREDDATLAKQFTREELDELLEIGVR